MNKLFVGNLDDPTSSADLQHVFGQQGQLVSAVVSSDRYTCNSRGLGFVEFASGDRLPFEQQHAQRSMSSLDGVDLHGRALLVSVTPERTGPQR